MFKDSRALGDDCGLVVRVFGEHWFYRKNAFGNLGGNSDESLDDDVGADAKKFSSVALKFKKLRREAG